MLDASTIYKYIIAPELQVSLLPLKIAVLIICFILFVAIIWFLMNTSYLRNLWLDDWQDYREWKRRYSMGAKRQQYKAKQNIASFQAKEEQPVERKIVQTVPRTDWQRILDKLESGRPLNFNLALLDADKLLQKKLDGRELDEFHAQKVNQARDLVEDVMADDSRDLTLEEVGEAIDVYKKAIESLD